MSSIKQTNSIALRVLYAIFLFSMLSCQEATETSKATQDSLITKINAIQEQIMAQGEISHEEETALASLCSIVSNNDGLANFSPEYRMILKDVDIAPVFEGCEALSTKETMVCFDDKVTAFIKREFNLSLAQDLMLPEPKQVDVFFIIDNEGHVSGMKVRNSEVNIQAEILRVLRKLPLMKPAKHDDQNVSVLCSLILTYGDSLEVDLVYIPERPTS